MRIRALVFRGSESGKSVAAHVRPRNSDARVKARQDYSRTIGRVLRESKRKTIRIRHVEMEFFVDGTSSFPIFIALINILPTEEILYDILRWCIIASYRPFTTCL